MGGESDTDRNTRRSREVFNFGTEEIQGALAQFDEFLQGIVQTGQQKFGEQFQNFESFPDELLNFLIGTGRGDQRATTQANIKASQGASSKGGRGRDGFAGADVRRLAQEGAQGERGIEAGLRQAHAQAPLEDFLKLSQLGINLGQSRNPLLGLLTSLVTGQQSNLSNLAAAQGSQPSGIGSLLGGLGSLAMAPVTGGGSLLGNLLFPGSTPGTPGANPGTGGPMFPIGITGGL